MAKEAAVPASNANIAAGNQSKPEKKKKEKKKGGIGGIIFLFLLVLLLVAALVLSVYFDWLSLRTRIIGTLSSLDPEYVAVETLKGELDTLQAQLASREAKIESEEARLEGLKAELDERERGIEEDEYTALPAFRGTLTDEKLSEFRSLGKVYSAMDPESAAGIMSELYSISDMATIVYYMNSSSAAAVLQALDSDTAAQITMEILRS